LRRYETDEPGYGVRSASIWTRLLGVEHTVIDSVEAEEDDGPGTGSEGVVIVAHARPAKGRRQRCGLCEVPPLTWTG
jgi:transposase